MSGLFADAALVHGSGVVMSGEVPVASQASRAQAQAAFLLLEDGMVDSLVLCGKGLTDDSGGISEAEAMNDVLLKYGVPQERILLEDQSFSTLGNWVNGSAVAVNAGFERILGVARPATVPRAKICADFVTRRCSVDFRGYHRSRERIKPTSVVREAASIMMLTSFLATHRDTPLEQLPDLYEQYKLALRASSIKNWRYAAAQQEEEVL